MGSLKRWIVVVSPKTIEEAVKKEMSLLAGCVASALLVSHGVRKDAALTFLFSQSVAVTFKGDSIRQIRPDLQSISGIFKKVIKIGPIKNRKRIHPGVFLEAVDAETLFRKTADLKIICCNNGIKINFLKRKNLNTIYAATTLSCNDTSLNLDLSKYGFKKVKLSNRRLAASQLITLLHNELDRWCLW